MASASATATARLGAIALVIACALIGALARDAHATPALVAAVSGEILIRYAPDARTSERVGIRERAGVAAKRDLLLPHTQLVRTLPGVSVPAAVHQLNRDPRVRYAHPNYVYDLHRRANDPRFGEQWSLENVGQTVDGSQGLSGADISAPAAWDTAVGSRNIKVAVIDGAIQHYHPDLAANIWRNPGEAVPGEERNGVDDDGNGLVDDLYGWDFIESNAADDHATAVAGIIGAVGNNSRGVAGVNWNVSLISLGACGTVPNSGCALSAIADATVYAARAGADVVNMSFGGPGDPNTPSDVMREAIAAAPHTLFVASAGNGGTDNDTAPRVPCGYDLPNVVCVTGTDKRDEQIYNYGATMVDLGAPAAGVLTLHLAQRVLFSDDFEGAQSRWDYAEASAPADPSKWRRVASTDSSHKLVLQDSAGVQYANNADTRTTTSSPVDLSGQQGCFVRLQAYLETESARDYLRVEAATNPAGPYEELVRVSGSTNVRWVRVVGSLEAFDGKQVYLRLRLTSDDANTADGVQVDDVEVRCDDPVASYSFGDGTSSAAPHVAGAAALVKSHMPGLSVAQLRERLLRTVDRLPSLAGKTVTGGRLNVARALTADLTPPTVTIEGGPTGVTNATAASFGVVASKARSTFECRLGAGSFEPCSSPKAYEGLGDGEHTVAVRATDEFGIVGPIAQRTWRVDATAPIVTITSGPSGSTTSQSATFAFAASEPDVAYECSLDGAPLSACSSPASYDGLTAGTHSFSVRGRDLAGNWSVLPTRTWTVTQEPVDGGAGGGGSDPTPPAGSIAGSAPAPLLTPPTIADPRPTVWAAPRVAVTIPRQDLTRLLRFGLVTRALVRGTCPCRLSQSLWLDRRGVKALGLSAGRGGARRLGALIARDSRRVSRGGLVRTTLRVRPALRARLSRLRRLDGWLETRTRDRRGLATIVRQQVRVQR